MGSFSYKGASTASNSNNESPGNLFDDDQIVEKRNRLDVQIEVIGSVAVLEFAPVQSIRKRFEVARGRRDTSTAILRLFRLKLDGRRQNISQVVRS